MPFKAQNHQLLDLLEELCSSVFFHQKHDIKIKKKKKKKAKKPQTALDSRDFIVWLLSCSVSQVIWNCFSSWNTIFTNSKFTGHYVMFSSGIKMIGHFFRKW